MHTKHSPATQGGAPDNPNDSEIERRLKLLAAYQRNRLEPEYAKRAAEWWTGPLTADQILHPTRMTALEVLSKLEANGYPCTVARVKDGFLKDWQKRAVFGAHTEDRAYWETKLKSISGIKPTSIGLLCGPVWFVDNDCDDPVAAREVDVARAEILGSGKIQRIGNRNRVGGAVPYRATSAQRWSAINGDRGSVETLAEAKQVIGFGLHTSGLWYDWQGLSPLDIPLSELPAPSADDMNRFRDECAKILKASNYVQGAGLGGGIKRRKKGEGGGTGEITRNADGLVCDGRDRFAMELAHRLAWKLADANGGKVDPEQLYADLDVEFTAKAVRDGRWAGQSGDLLLRQKANRQAALVELEWLKKSEVRWLGEDDDRKPEIQIERMSLAEVEARLKQVMLEIGEEILAHRQGGVPGPIKLAELMAGIGKTTEAVKLIARLVKEGKRFLFCVPDHRLAKPIVKALRLLGVGAMIFGGYDAKVDPDNKSDDAERFCLRPDDAKAVQRMGLPVKPNLCQKREPNPDTPEDPSTDIITNCPLQDQCKRWEAEHSEPDVWVLPHDYLVLPNLPVKGRFHGVFIDETPHTVLSQDERAFTLTDQSGRGVYGLTTMRVVPSQKPLPELEKLSLKRRNAEIQQRAAKEGKRLRNLKAKDRPWVFDEHKTAELNDISFTVSQRLKTMEEGQHLTADLFKDWPFIYEEPADPEDPSKPHPRLKDPDHWAKHSETFKQLLRTFRRARYLEGAHRNAMGKVNPAMASADIADILQAGSADIGVPFGPFVDLWRTLEDELHEVGEGSTDSSGRIVMTHRKLMEKGPKVPVLSVLPRKRIAKRWAKLPMYLLDATPPETEVLAKAFDRPVERVANLHAEIPGCVKIVQVVNSPPGSHSSLGVDKKRRKAAEKAKKPVEPTRKARLLADFIRWQCRQLMGPDGEVLGRVGLAATLQARKLLVPLICMPNLEPVHYQATTGTNDLEGVRVHIVLQPEHVPGFGPERQAEYVLNTPVDHRDRSEDHAHYDRVPVVHITRDGRKFETTYWRHPDERVEPFRWLPAEGQGIQGLERARLARRTDPLTVYVFTDACLGYPPNEVYSAAEVLGAAQITMEGHGIRTESPSLLAELLPEVFETESAAKQALQKDREQGGANSGGWSVPLNVNIILRNSDQPQNFDPPCENRAGGNRPPPEWEPLRAQRAGPGQVPKDFDLHWSVDPDGDVARRLEQLGYTMTRMRDPLRAEPEVQPNLVSPENQIDLTPETVKAEQARRGVSNAQLATITGWDKANLRKWLGGKRALPKAYRPALTEWLMEDQQDFEQQARQGKPDHADFPPLVSDHLKDLPGQVANMMALRGTSAAQLGKRLNIPWFVIDAFITGRTTLDPERTEDLVSWLIDDSLPTLEQQLDALLEELLFPPPPKPVMVPSFFYDEPVPVWPDPQTGELPGPLGCLTSPDGQGLIPSLLAEVDQ